ncbi:MAG: DUF711 family protein, partial [Firmicutes bacterium]|nr:DUF711 family protein [Candidatus Stercoripulliclostridium pullicola]
MINRNEIMETVRMIREHHLDIRTITMGLTLFDCITDSGKRTAEKVYEKIVREAGGICAVGGKISAMYGIPIVNKRVSVTPISLVGASSGDYIGIARAMDRAAREIGIDFIGGYSAMVQKGATEGETAFLKSIPEALATT